MRHLRIVRLWGVSMVGWFYEANGHNPYENLALEEYLLRFCEEKGEAVLYLWQNDKTIVIGRNQNAYTECSIEYVKQNDVFIARRLTGGGAVYHDLGNLNFTIILPKALFDVKRSTGLIVAALRKLGIDAVANGRNDICVDGRKVSGNAYYSNNKAGIHHGTILYNVNCDTISKALSVSKNKLSKHGVKSVKSRVCNIFELYPDITIEKIKESFRLAFCEEYCIDSFNELKIDENAYSGLVVKYSSKAWNLDKIRDYKIMSSQSFSWGKVDLSLLYDGEALKKIEIATDALEADIIEDLKNAINALISEQLTKL